MDEELYNLLLEKGLPQQEAYRIAMRGGYDAGPTGGTGTRVSANMAFNPTTYKTTTTNNPIGTQIDDRGRIISPASSGQSRFDRRFGVEQPDYSRMIDPQMNRDENIQMMMSSEYGEGLTREEAEAAMDGTSGGNRGYNQNNAFPYINPWGGDMNTNAFMLGRSIGADKGTRGRGMGIVSGIGNLGLGLARTIGSGIANQSETQRNYLDYLDRRNRGSRQYTNQQTSRDQNYMGGSMLQDGGIFRKRYGDTPFEEINNIKGNDLEGYAEGLRVDRKQARLNRKMINERIRGGYIDNSGLDYSQFSRTKTRDFITDAPDRLKFEDGGELPQEGAPQQLDPNVQEEIQVIASQLSEEFQTIEEAAGYLQEQGIEPQMAEMILEVFRMIKEEQSVSEGQQEELPKSQVMRDTMSGGMEMDMGFRYGGRKNRNYPKL